MENLFAVLMIVSSVCFLLSWLTPNTFSPLFKNKLSKGWIRFVLGSSVIVFFVLFGITSDGNSVATSQVKPESVSSQESVIENVQTKPQEDVKKAQEEQEVQLKIDAEHDKLMKYTNIMIESTKKAMDGYSSSNNAAVLASSSNYSEAYKEISKADKFYSDALSEINSVTPPDQFKEIQELTIRGIDKFKQANTFMKNGLDKINVASIKRAGELLDEGNAYFLQAQQKLVGNK